MNATPMKEDHSRFVLLASLAFCWVSVLDWTGRETVWVHEIDGVRTAIGPSPYDVQPWTLFLLIAALLGAFLVVRGKRFGGWYTLFYTVAVAVTDRARRGLFVSSDVINASREAASLVLSGKNPYFHHFVSTIPVGSPFPYPPGEPLFYALSDGLLQHGYWTDQWTGIALVFVLAALAPIVGVAATSLGVALLSAFHLPGWTALNGSNDVTLAFLFLLAVVLLAWSERAREHAWPAFWEKRCLEGSAFFLAWAMLFKATAWPFGPFLFAYLWKKKRTSALVYLRMVLIICVFVLIPFLFPSPSGLISNFLQGLSVHSNTWGVNVWSALHRMEISVDAFSAWIRAFELIAAAAGTAVMLRRPADTLGVALLQGIAIFTTAAVLARWSSPDYFAFVGLTAPAALALSGWEKS